MLNYIARPKTVHFWGPTCIVILLYSDFIVYFILFYCHIVFKTGTVILRMALFPVVIMIQKNMVIMNNHMPTVQKLQEQFTKARRRGDMLEGELVRAIMFT